MPFTSIILTGIVPPIVNLNKLFKPGNDYSDALQPIGPLFLPSTWISPAWVLCMSGKGNGPGSR